MEIKKDGFIAKILPDTNCPSPREINEHFTKIVAWHRKYSLEKEGAEKFDNPTEAIEFFKKNKCIYAPLFMFDHGNVAIKISEDGKNPFNDRFDSGFLGFIYAERKDILKWFGIKNLTKGCKQKIKDIMNDEIKDLTSYINGDVYTISLYSEKHEESEEVIDVAGLLFGFKEAESLALEMIDDAITRQSAKTSLDNAN